MDPTATPTVTPTPTVTLHLEPVDTVMARSGLARATVYALVAAGAFPRPVKLGRASRWVAHEVDAWIAARMAERDTVGA